MYVLLVVIVMTVSGTLIISLTRQKEYENLEERIKTAASYVINNVADATTQEDVLEYLEKAIDETRLDRVFLLDTRSRIIYNKTPLEEQDFFTSQVMTAQNRGTLKQLDKVTLSNGVSYVGYAAPIVFEDRVIYVVYVLGDLTNVEKSIQNAIMAMMIAVVVAMVIAIFLGILFSDFITRPIAMLSKRARDMTRGRLDTKLRVFSDDEIGQLTKNFNRMAISLSETLNQVTSEKNKLEIVFQNMSDGLLVFDKVGVMIHSNPASVRMLQLENQISFKEIFNAYIDITYPELRDMIKEETYSRVILVKNRYFNLYFAKFLDQYNEAVGIICVIQDITEHKRLEEVQKQFVANVSHELRTPLTTIKSYAETLLEGAMDDKEIAIRFLNVINHEGDRMTALVQDLLDLSKLDNEQGKLEMTEINLSMLLNECIEKYQIQATKKKQSLIYHPATQPYLIIGDSNRVEQVIKNIVTNAIKYSEEKAIIEIHMNEESKYYRIVIRDTGVGIPEEDIDHIFERFYRVDKARSREMGGTGLGLAIAKEIMDYHGGKIEVESQIGKGTIFHLLFPRQLNVM